MLLGADVVQEAYWAAGSDLDVAHVHATLAAILAEVFHDGDGDGGKRHWALAAMLKVYLLVLETVEDVACHVAASWLVEVEREIHGGHLHRRLRRCHHPRAESLQRS